MDSFKAGPDNDWTWERIKEQLNAKHDKIAGKRRCLWYSTVRQPQRQGVYVGSQCFGDTSIKLYSQDKRRKGYKNDPLLGGKVAKAKFFSAWNRFCPPERAMHGRSVATTTSGLMLRNKLANRKRRATLVSAALQSALDDFEKYNRRFKMCKHHALQKLVSFIQKHGGLVSLRQKNYLKNLPKGELSKSCAFCKLLKQKSAMAPMQGSEKIVKITNF